MEKCRKSRWAKERKVARVEVIAADLCTAARAGLELNRERDAEGAVSSPRFEGRHSGYCAAAALVTFQT